MPVVRVEFLAGRSQEQKREIADVFTRELVRIARCNVTDVHVVFNDVDEKNWAVGGVISEHTGHSK